MSTTSDTIRVVIPLTMKRRNGRPRILPPEEIDVLADGSVRDPRLLRAIARAWDWRRRLDRGEVATIKDIAVAEGVTVPFVSRFLRLAYLSPDVLERLLIHRRPCAVPLDRLAGTALVPWAEQVGAVFGTENNENNIKAIVSLDVEIGYSSGRSMG